MDLSYLGTMSEGDFEAERSRLIMEHIQSLPEDKRKVAYLEQLQIDHARITMSPEAFMTWLGERMRENLANLGDQMLALTRVLQPGEPPIKPASER
jgi:hypothetical protein